jgi:hypothetical protein
MTLKIVKPTEKAEKQTHTTVDTIELDHGLIGGWKPPPFQRPLKVNAKVTALVETIKLDGGVIPGVITLGVIGKDTYLLDGQHRIHAFLLSELERGYADIRVCHFDSVGAMGEEFVALNSRLVNFRPDDILKGLEASSSSLQKIRAKCPFVGYDMVRRGDRSPLLSMSAVLRCWYGSGPEAPTGGGTSAMELARTITDEDADAATSFLQLAYHAWGRDSEYVRLWGNLNLILCMWLYRRTVIAQYSPNTVKLSKELFQKCLLSLSANGLYLDWLVGRNLNDRDRSPAYARVKALFAKRVEDETGKKPRLPSPTWAHGGGGKPGRV